MSIKYFSLFSSNLIISFEIKLSNPQKEMAFDKSEGFLFQWEYMIVSTIRRHNTSFSTKGEGLEGGGGVEGVVVVVVVVVVISLD